MKALKKILNEEFDDACKVGWGEARGGELVAKLRPRDSSCRRQRVRLQGCVEKQDFINRINTLKKARDEL